VAEIDGRLLGMAACHAIPLLHRHAPTCRLIVLVVSDSARRTGVGAALVERVEAEGRRLGCDRLEVTSSGDRDAAHRFYEALGFEDRPKRFVKPLD
jgi:GNAT superfamily N-acetyltransferase